ncbi:MAG TPA: hypothetical protein VKE74_14560 [Gemmataceae bacterium]|nr:hypothetical protein [Gemmataceae bacterium]
MRRGLVLAVVAPFALTAGWLAADEPKADKKPPTEKEVKELMQKTHKGKDAPLARVEVELKKDAPEWDQVAKDAKAFTDMGDVLKRRPAYPSPAKYVSSAAELEKAAKDKDRAAAGKAFVGLNQSCTSCHCYYVPK